MPELNNFRRYDFIRYNRYGVLRPSLGLWLSLTFLCRHVITILLVAMAAGRGMQGGNNAMDMSDFGHLVTPIFMLSDLPALMLLLALAARLPTAGVLPRAIWRAGRLLLLLSILAYAGLIVRHWPAVGISGFAVADWLGFAGTSAIALYVLGSTYLADLFREFPDRPNSNDRPFRQVH